MQSLMIKTSVLSYSQKMYIYDAATHTNIDIHVET